MGSMVAVPIAVGLSLISFRPSDVITFCKWVYSYGCVTASRQITKKRFDIYDVEAQHDPVKSNFLPAQIEIESESPQPDSHLLYAADEIFFYGVNSSSECLIVRLARAVNNEAEAWVYMKLKDGKIYKLSKTTDFQQSGSDKAFTCGGLKMHYNSPMKRWRIFYNGLLRETSDENPEAERMVYVKFAFLWRASSGLFDMTCDVNSAALGLGLAKAKWKSFTPPLQKLNDALNFYAQSGVINGTIRVDGEPNDRNLYLFGERMRYLGDTSLANGVEFTHVLGQITRNGSIVHIAKATIPGIVDELGFGFVVFPNGMLSPFTDPEPQLEITSLDDNEEIEAVFHAEGIEMKLSGNSAGRLSHFESNKGWDGFLSIDCLNIEMNGVKGAGVLIRGKILKPSTRIISEKPHRETSKDIPLVVHFSEEVCQISEVTGGKGSSLGKLTRLSKKFQNFIVPEGIVVTTSAYESFISKEIRKEIKRLEEILYGNLPGDVKAACERVMDEVVKANIPDAVLQAVVRCLQKSYGEELHTKKFAIRSSATGEDTEQMSAAGQMETFLGITGLSEIMSYVKKCWASQFGFIAVQYKRQNGQVINSPMAVVIQEMIPCDVAGVLFTCDPLTGNPALMSITANYGLGESVVSGSEEPDTIVLERYEDDQLRIKDRIIGAKSHRIVIKDGEGTTVEDVAENEKKSCCLNDAMALRLGNTAVQIEKSYRSNRDIEWGFWNNNLYIFQSRPVTSGTGETDYEIDHEFDGPMRIENEYFTVCNVGEVMPGALSPLGLDVLDKYFTLAMQTGQVVEYQSCFRPKYFSKPLIHMYGHAMIYALDLLEPLKEGNKDVAEATMIGLFGRILDDEEIYVVTKERFGHIKKPFNPTKRYLLMKNLLTAGSRFKRTQKRYMNYHIDVERMKDPKDVFDVLMYACTDLTDVFQSHMIATQTSSIWNMMILNVLGNAKGGINPEVYRDFAKLLTSITGVESADVPCAMQNLAFQISQEIHPDDFKKMELNEILQWLETSTSQAGIMFRNFLKTHGHRCLREFDIRSVSWGEDPKLLVQLLQNLVGTVSEATSTKTAEGFDEMLKTLGLSLKMTPRLLLKYFLLPQCHKAVQVREGTKSLLIRIQNEWRKGYKHLAKLMVSEGRIPDEDLMFFMRLEDIKELFSNRSPQIISRANHRRRRYPVIDKYIFPEIAKGFPKPINADDEPIVTNEENFQMQGIPVSQGVAKGFVRVALTLEEAAHLKSGEILLTYSTDIGWTPYFPSLAGVVTELGGLISHGAVVSREYGLPCIAGLHGATRQFQTGDYVLLDGNRGILQKIASPE